MDALAQKGLTVIPTKMYLKDGLAKTYETFLIEARDFEGDSLSA